MFFSNTNRTNLTNCLGCDPVCIRGIREICGQLNIIHTLICFSNTNRTNLTNLVGRDMVYIRGIREIRGQEPAASGNACKSVYNPYASKEKVKKSVVKDSVCIGDIREFFDLRSVAEGSQDDLLQVEFRI